MAAANLLVLIDDIASVLDDVAVLSKVAAKKTAGVLGDDLALNANQVSGVSADRELPVVWAVAKGSMLNKVILVPAALAISAFAPWAVTPLLIVGGLYLCFEGFEKLAHRFFHTGAEIVAASTAAPATDLAALEATRVKGAVRTDFILSAEIVAITLGTVAAQPLLTQFTVLAAISVAMTVGVYGLVAGIVKLDDAGLLLQQSSGSNAWVRAQRGLGAAVVGAAPWLMKTLSVVGTVAMFLVGGGILTHGVPWLHHAVEALSARASAVPGVGAVFAAVTPLLLDALAGVAAGAVALLLVSGVQRLRRPSPILSGESP